MSKKSVKIDQDLGEILGPEWSEIVLTRGGLIVPGWRRPFPPGELRAMFFRCQQVSALEFRCAQLEKDMARALAAQEAAEKKAAQYRRLVVAESRLGLALLAITSGA